MRRSYSSDIKPSQVSGTSKLMSGWTAVAAEVGPEKCFETAAAVPVAPPELLVEDAETLLLVLFPDEEYCAGVAIMLLSGESVSAGCKLGGSESDSVTSNKLRSSAL